MWQIFQIKLKFIIVLLLYSNVKLLTQFVFCLSMWCDILYCPPGESCLRHSTLLIHHNHTYRAVHMQQLIIKISWKIPITHFFSLCTLQHLQICKCCKNTPEQMTPQQPFSYKDVRAATSSHCHCPQQDCQHSVETSRLHLATHTTLSNTANLVR